MAFKNTPRGSKRPSYPLPPAARMVVCRGCMAQVSVLRPVCDSCIEVLPAELRERFDAAHAAFDVPVRIRVQDEVRAWFIARDGLTIAGRVITPSIAPAFEDKGSPSWAR